MPAWANPEARKKVESLLTGGGEVLRAIDKGADTEEEIATHIEESADAIPPEARAALLCAHENAAVMQFLQNGPASKEELATKLHELETRVDDGLVTHLDYLGATVDEMIANLSGHNMVHARSNGEIKLTTYGNDIFQVYTR
ncbi:hypothetical protein MUK72_14770 (plasmid) [Halococcus dombrowskii]|uniref:Uncharacterized protein n=1 Tax=Halococcus dombrowskii TaxID=179637 RepID=A0AAV3SL38_HALDO|nr:hypothetical protein [Halococcus dombrowskii]UOO96903.1 hypothetical protein MUK72_14770 [Halococcus dombrowskii]